ncbi:MAG: 3-oxoacyl-ACP synthase, partial [Desulfobacterales bacterium]|nr:3-oxoacyl-ACP synthase [Desulfobacterales bacterium]
KIGDFVFGTDGKGADNLCVKGLGVRKETDSGKIENLYMNGPEIFTFTLRAVPDAVNKILKKTGMTMEEIDHFVFHQANGFILEHLRKKTAIPKEKFHTYLENVGNTVSSTIPIALEQLYSNNMIKKNQKIMLVAFGVGYSWAVTVLNT